MAVKSRSKSPALIPFLRLAYSAPEPRESTAEELRRLTLPATKALPFVRLRANDQPMWRPESYWSVRTTGKRDADARLGRKYAHAALAAAKADQNSQLIAHIIQDMIKESANSGRLSIVARGFLAEISEAMAGTL